MRDFLLFNAIPVSVYRDSADINDGNSPF